MQADPLMQLEYYDKKESSEIKKGKSIKSGCLAVLQQREHTEILCNKLAWYIINSCKV